MKKGGGATSWMSHATEYKDDLRNELSREHDGLLHRSVSESMMSIKTWRKYR
jgi:hypothetical protein